MRECPCGSFAINHDPERLLCDCCWRDAEIERLRADNAGLRVDLEDEANWDTLCWIADRLTNLTGAPRGMSLPEQLEMGLAAVERLRAELDNQIAEIERLRSEISDLRACALGAILDDYRECLTILSDFVVGGDSLAGRLQVALDGLRATRDAAGGER